MERFRCAACDSVLTNPVQRVPLVRSRQDLDQHAVHKVALLAPGTYAVDEDEYGHDRERGSYLLAPGDVLGTRFDYEHCDVGCWSLTDWRPNSACVTCGALVAARMDDCGHSQWTRLLPSAVVVESGPQPTRREPAEPLYAWESGWYSRDEAGAGAERPSGDEARAASQDAEPRHTGLLGARWARGLRDEVYRDDPPG